MNIISVCDHRQAEDLAAKSVYEILVELGADEGKSETY